MSTWTAEGQTLGVSIQPPQIVDRVLIRTDASPSIVAWHEIGVIGRLPGARRTAATGATPVVVNWPKDAGVGSFNQPT